MYTNRSLIGQVPVNMLRWWRFREIYDENTTLISTTMKVEFPIGNLVAPETIHY